MIITRHHQGEYVGHSKNITCSALKTALLVGGGLVYRRALLTRQKNSARPNGNWPGRGMYDVLGYGAHTGNLDHEVTTLTVRVGPRPSIAFLRYRTPTA